MHSLPSVSICLLAYNEESNIDNILKQVTSQKQKGFVIEQIRVFSDGSTDNTVHIARKYEVMGVEVIDGKENRGLTSRQNEVISTTSSDILVLLNSDIHLGDNKVIVRLIAPILKGADLSAQWTTPVKPQTFIERILYAGFHLKYYIYTRHNNGNNIYTCIGHMRALSRDFYANVAFPEVSDGEDQYLYLNCISHGYTYAFAGESNSYFKLPDTFSDYKSYAKRIFQTQKKFGNVFDEALVQAERKVPLWLQIEGCFYGFFKQHIFALLYIMLHMIMQYWALRQPINSDKVYKVSKSSKVLDTTLLT